MPCSSAAQRSRPQAEDNAERVKSRDTSRARPNEVGRGSSLRLMAMLRAPPETKRRPAGLRRPSRAPSPKGSRRSAIATNTRRVASPGSRPSGRHAMRRGLFSLPRAPRSAAGDGVGVRHSRASGNQATPGCCRRSSPTARGPRWECGPSSARGAG